MPLPSSRSNEQYRGHWPAELQLSLQEDTDRVHACTGSAREHYCASAGLDAAFLENASEDELHQVCVWGRGGTRGDESVDGHALACISSQAHRPPRTHILLGYVQAMLNVQLSEGPVPSAHRARQLLWLYLVCSHGQ